MTIPTRRNARRQSGSTVTTSIWRPYRCSRIWRSAIRKTRMCSRGWVSCLIDKSAAMEDQDGAAKERVRARGLLLKAQKLGNNSTLLQNLLQLVPDNGVVA